VRFKISEARCKILLALFIDEFFSIHCLNSYTCYVVFGIVFNNSKTTNWTWMLILARTLFDQQGQVQGHVSKLSKSVQALVTLEMGLSMIAVWFWSVTRTQWEMTLKLNVTWWSLRINNSIDAHLLCNSTANQANATRLGVTLTLAVIRMSLGQ